MNTLDERPWLFVHLGLHKTGSTAIQDFLARNRGWLDGHGFVYPWDGVAINHRHFGALMSRPGRPPDLAAARKRWRWLIAPQLRRKARHHAILSWEGFAQVGLRSAPKQRAQLLRECFAGYRLHVILYVRRQDHWLEAMYNQSVKTGIVTLTYEEYAQRHLRRPLNAPKAMRFWRNLVGAERLTVRVYDRKELVNGDAVDDFLHLLALRREPETRDPRRLNPRLSPDSVAIKRWVNGLGLHRSLTRRVRDVLLFAQRSGPTRQASLSPETQRALKRAYKRHNRQLAKRFLGRPRLFSDW